jgi:fumarate reductase subunit D
MKRKRRDWAMEYERSDEPVAPLTRFGQRMLTSTSIALALLLFSLTMGVAGYHWIAGVPRLVDCVYSASMIMGGMGPVGAPPTTDAAKWFQSFYALWCGVVLLVSVGLLLSPAVHRLLHHFHVQTGD